MTSHPGAAARREPLGHGLPDPPGPAVEGEAERGVRTPAEIVPAFDDVAKNAFEIDPRDAVPHPLRAQLGRLGRPDLAVVRSHEHAGQTRAETPHDPVGERRRRAFGLSGVPSARRGAPPGTPASPARADAGCCSAGVGDEPLAHPDPGLALVLEPLLSEQRIQHPVEVAHSARRPRGRRDPR